MKARQNRTLLAAATTLVIAVFAATALLAAERLNDKDVKALMQRIHDERDRFEDQLDGTIKRAVLRGPNGEVDVSKFLDDLQTNVNNMKDRFKDDYAASAEVTTVLRQGSAIQRFMATQKPDLDGASEWTKLAASLDELAKVYNTSMPLTEGQQARRMNDQEVKKAANDLSESADRFKKELDTTLKADTTITPATREAALKEVDIVKQDAKKLGSTVGDGKPASGEAKALVDRVAKLRAASTGRALSPAAQTAWTSVESGLDVIAQVFGLPAR